MVCVEGMNCYKEVVLQLKRPTIGDELARGNLSVMNSLSRLFHELLLAGCWRGGRKAFASASSTANTCGPWTSQRTLRLAPTSSSQGASSHCHLHK